MSAGLGHNSGGSIEAKELILLAERVEHVNDEIKNLQDDRKDIYAEAKSRGYDPATLREVVKRRALIAKDKSKYDEKQALLQTYLVAFGIE